MKMPRFTMPLFLVGAIMMMVVPVPAVILDVLLAVNITIAFLILLGTVFLEDTMDMSIFPSLLLVTTLMRLSLNVSSTRLILLHGYGGKVIETFGNFVVGGSVVVGLVVFLILIVIQFVVITNGAGRVAEVAARFTLDAMPGRQMAIDADLSAGLIDQEQARAQRKRIAKEADFYGAMDGASKFVKGDAIAGIIIVVINLFGGFAIGMGMHGMDFSQAINTYALLSVGEGLVAQIPALLISIATGLLVTKVGSDDPLSMELGRQLVRRRDAVRTTGFVVGALALLPGLPKLPFLLLAGTLLLISSRPERVEEPVESEAPALAASSDDPEALMSEMRVEPLELHLAYDILDLIDTEAGGDLLGRVRALRRQIAMELGFIMPLVRTRDDASLADGTYSILLHGVEIGRGTAPRGKVLALPLDDGAGLRSIGGIETVEPVFNLPAFWIADNQRREAAALGSTVVDRSSAVVTHLAEVARRHAAELISRQDVQMLLEGLRYDEPLLANEVGTDYLPIGTLHAVLRGLLEEGVPVRDLGRIVEAIATRALETRNVEQLIASARVALGSTIAGKIAGQNTMGVLTLDPIAENALLEGLREIDGEVRLVVDPARVQGIADDIQRILGLPADFPTVVVCSQALRRPLQRLLAGSGIDITVLAYPELPAHVQLVTKGVIGNAHAQI